MTQACENAQPVAWATKMEMKIGQREEEKDSSTYMNFTLVSPLFCVVYTTKSPAGRGFLIVSADALYASKSGGFG